MPSAMLDELQLFRGKDFVVNGHLTIHHPTIGEICDFGEERYFNMVSRLCATPSDFKVTLWDEMGKDWEEVDDIDLFGAICIGFPQEDTRILFGDFPLDQLVIYHDPEIDDLVLVEAVWDRSTGQPVELKPDGAKIDRYAYTMMTEFLRCIHNLEKHVDKCVTQGDKMYLLDKDRSKLRRQKHAKDAGKSVLVPLVSALVNCKEFKYDHSTVWDLPIYAFYDSVRRIQKIKYSDRLVYGVMVDPSKMPQDMTDWMSELK